MTRKQKPAPAPVRKPAAKPAVIAKKAAPTASRKAAPALVSKAPAPKAPAAKPVEPLKAAAPKGKSEVVAPKGKTVLSGLPERMPEDRQSQLKLLIARGKEQGYLTYAQVNDHLPSEIVDPRRHRTPSPSWPAIPPPRLTRRPSRRRPQPWRRSMPSWAARPIRCACTCARWARSNC